MRDFVGSLSPVKIKELDHAPRVALALETRLDDNLTASEIAEFLLPFVRYNPPPPPGQAATRASFSSESIEHSEIEHSEDVRLEFS